MIRFIVAVLVTFLVSTACTTTGGPERTTARNPNVITATELAPHSSLTAREAIQRLRPAFLRTRGPSSIMLNEGDTIVVYVDNTRMGGPEILDQVRANAIREIRYLSSSDASSRFGTGHTSGAILITTM